MFPSVSEMAGKGVFFGTSSWKYPGWQGLVYRREYPTEKAFNEGALEEYALTYPTVGVDHTYYAWPTEKTLEKYVRQTPEGFRFGLKVTERITVLRFPNLRRYGKDAGKANPDFLNADCFIENFLRPLEPFRDRLGPLMFEFSQFYPGMIRSGSEFLERLDGFFTALGESRGFQFAVEIRNGNWLQPPYFALLQRHGISHVFNSWTRMPSLGEQLALAGPYRPPAYVARVLLQPGTRYEEAVEAFSPYDHLQAPSEGLREEVAGLVRRALDLGVPAYVFVNNRSEGCAPRTIEGILEKLA